MSSSARDPRSDRLRRRGSGRVADTKQTVHIADITADRPIRVATQSAIAPPSSAAIGPCSPCRCSRTDELIGAITIYRQEVRPFTDKQIALLETFADQAVIAIENTRLFERAAQSTGSGAADRDRRGAQGHRRSPTDLQPVLDTLVESAARLCEAEHGDHIAAARATDFAALRPHMASPEFDESAATAHRRRPRRHWSGASLTGSVARSTIPMSSPIPNIPWLRARSAAGRLPDHARLSRCCATAAVGVICSGAPEVRPFTDKQIELLETFADQAVIAIENTRLFEEVQARNARAHEALEQQTATSDVLKRHQPLDVRSPARARHHRRDSAAACAGGECADLPAGRWRVLAWRAATSADAEHVRLRCTRSAAA